MTVAGCGVVASGWAVLIFAVVAAVSSTAVGETNQTQTRTTDQFSYCDEVEDSPTLNLFNFSSRSLGFGLSVGQNKTSEDTFQTVTSTLNLNISLKT